MPKKKESEEANKTSAATLRYHQNSSRVRRSESDRRRPFPPQSYTESSEHHILKTPARGGNRIHQLLQKKQEEDLGNKSYQIAQFLRSNHSEHTEMEEILRLLRLAAEKGNVFAYVELAAIYWLGDGVPKDYEEAGKWLRLCAYHGFCAHQFHLYKALTSNKLEPAFENEAEYWLDKAQTGGYHRNSLNTFPF
jgi:TPR repeat protein